MVKNVAGYDLPKLVTGALGNAGSDYARGVSTASHSEGVADDFD